MKAELVFNTENEPRILLTEFEIAEQVALQGEPDLDLIKVVNNTKEGLSELAFEIVNNDKIKVITAMKTQIDELKEAMSIILTIAYPGRESINEDGIETIRRAAQSVIGDIETCAHCPTPIYKNTPHRSGIPNIGKLCNPCHTLWSKEKSS